MTLANIVVYVALIGLLVGRRVRGRPVEGAKRLLVLPVVLTIVGWQDLAHAEVDAAGITVAVIGSVVSLGLGALRGRTDRLSVRDGLPWVRWGAPSVAVFGANVAAKLVIDVVGVAFGGTSAGASSSLVLTFGLSLLGESAVLWLRCHPQATGDLLAGRWPR